MCGGIGIGLGMAVLVSSFLLYRHFTHTDWGGRAVAATAFGMQIRTGFFLCCLFLPVSIAFASFGRSYLRISGLIISVAAFLQCLALFGAAIGGPFA